MEKTGIKYALLSVLFLILTVRCTRDVDLELPYVPPRLVLNASLTPDQDVAAYLSKSWFLLDSVPDSDIQGGKIRVYINGQFQGNMQQTDIPGDSIHPKGQFCLPGCRAKAGDRVCLEAEATGFEPVTGETRIPEEVCIQSVDTVRFIRFDAGDFLKEQMRLYIRFQDKPGIRNYYRLLVERITEYQKGDTVKVTSSFFNPEVEYDSFLYLYYEDPVFQSVATNPTQALQDAYTGRGSFPDAMFDGQDYTVRSVIAPVSHSYRNDTVSIKVHYDIRLMAISEEYYYYLTVIRNFSLTFGDAYVDGLLEPAATYTNVRDGFGVISGYQVAKWRITMPLGPTPPFYYSDEYATIYNLQ